LTVSNYRVAAALFYSPNKSYITVTSCNFDSNTNTVTDATSDAGVGLAFKLKDSFITLAPATSKTITFSNNIANVGPALAVYTTVASTVPSSGFPYTGTTLPTTVIGTATFNSNVARYEGASIYVNVPSADAYWGKLLTIDATTKKNSWPTTWTFTTNKAYVGATGTKDTTTPYNGGA
jgi:hypothetical protein